MTTIALIRHGVTVWNLERRIQGQQDIDLHEDGRLQAEKLARSIRPDSWDLIVTSDLRRAVETAQIISQITGVPIRHYDQRLRERGLGELEGTTLQERLDRFGEMWWNQANGVESHDRMIERGISCISDYTHRYPGKHLLFVSHGGWIRRVLTQLLLKEIKDPIHNTSITILKKTSDIWKTEQFNCTAHLENQTPKTGR